MLRDSIFWVCRRVEEEYAAEKPTHAFVYFIMKDK